jgi:hypothetical protein
VRDPEEIRNSEGGCRVNDLSIADLLRIAELHPRDVTF